MLFVWLARVSVGFARGVFVIFDSARGVFSVQHGSCLLQHGSSLVLHGSCNFSSSEVGNLIFSQYSGLFCFENLNWINLKILLMNLDELRT